LFGGNLADEDDEMDLMEQDNSFNMADGFYNGPGN
jgi:hypothetical protein